MFNKIYKNLFGFDMEIVFPIKLFKIGVTAQVVKFAGKFKERKLKKYVSIFINYPKNTTSYIGDNPNKIDVYFDRIIKTLFKIKETNKWSAELVYTKREKPFYVKISVDNFGDIELMEYIKSITYDGQDVYIPKNEKCDLTNSGKIMILNSLIYTMSLYNFRYENSQFNLLNIDKLW